MIGATITILHAYKCSRYNYISVKFHGFLFFFLLILQLKMRKRNTKYKSRKDEEKQLNRYLQMFDVPGAHYLCFDFILIYDDRFLWGSDAYTIACHFVLCTLARSFYALLGILRMRQNCNKINVSVNVAYTQSEPG